MYCHYCLMFRYFLWNFFCCVVALPLLLGFFFQTWFGKHILKKCFQREGFLNSFFVGIKMCHFCNLIILIRIIHNTNNLFEILLEIFQSLSLHLLRWMLLWTVRIPILIWPRGEHRVLSSRRRGQGSRGSVYRIIPEDSGRGKSLSHPVETYTVPQSTMVFSPDIHRSGMIK